MKKSRLILILFILGIVGGFIWLLKGTDAKHLQRQDITVTIEDNFEK